MSNRTRWEAEAGLDVHLLSDLLGSPLVDASGRPLARVKDLSVCLRAAHPLADRVLVEHRDTWFLLPWTALAGIGAEAFGLCPGAALTAFEVEPLGLPLERDELLLARDVLDSQVVDLVGHRLSRVSDLLLLLRADGTLELAAADVGTAGLLHRAGLGWMAPHSAPVVVDWQDLHLTSGRGHVVQLRTGTVGLHRLDPHGLAELLARLSTAQATDVVRTVGPERAAAALDRSHPQVGRRVLHALGPDEAHQVMTAASPRQAERLDRLGRRAAPLRRRILRTAGWRLHRPPAPSHRGPLG